MTSISLTKDGLKGVKYALKSHFPDVKSSHLTEALAAACGFNSHAALLAQIREGDPNDPDYVLLDEGSFWRRLKAISDCPNHRNLIFDQLSYDKNANVIRTISQRFHEIDYAKSTRMRAWRNAMVAAINIGIDRRLFTVRPGDNRWPDVSTDIRGRGNPYVYRFSIDSIPAIASVGDAGFDELSIHVAFWPKREADHWVPVSNAGFLAGDLFASGWLERRDGAWLQVAKDSGRSWSFRCRKERLDVAASLMVRSKGYSDRGSFKI